ncbi:hypothetical protein [Arthrobacter sp. R-11]|uniref:hypothetical protein n=1 Tax=Arthrobacter sp. R-11 TaxID=3404053 RepID=UPI003CFA630C
MKITMVESICVSKTPESAGADRLLVADGLWGVVDGSSAKGPEKGSAPTGAELADIVETAVHDIPVDADAVRAMDILTRAIAGRAAPDYLHSASVVLYSGLRNEIWLVGSGGFCVDGETVTFSPPHERAASRVRAAFLTASLRDGYALDRLAADDPGRELILGLLRQERHLRNVDELGDYYFGALDGRAVPSRHILVRALPDATRDVTLVTDGYPVVLPTLVECEASLAELLADDPLLIGRHPQTKSLRPGDRSFDDRALIRLARG